MPSACPGWGYALAAPLGVLKSAPSPVIPAKSANAIFILKKNQNKRLTAHFACAIISNAQEPT
jgi:hypothetical protein